MNQCPYSRLVLLVCQLVKTFLNAILTSPSVANTFLFCSRNISHSSRNGNSTDLSMLAGLSTLILSSFHIRKINYLTLNNGTRRAWGVLMETFFNRGFVNSLRKHSDSKSLYTLYFPCQLKAENRPNRRSWSYTSSLIPHFLLTWYPLLFAAMSRASWLVDRPWNYFDQVCGLLSVCLEDFSFVITKNRNQ